MLTITLPKMEGWDETTEEFVVWREQTIKLEHSLVSLSKWESKWHKPFLHSDKSDEETVDYIRCMNVSSSIDDSFVYRLTKKNIEQINAYISDSMTATTFNNKIGRRNREIITSELIYYWMVANGIPVEFEKWHLNRLITLIRICGIKNQPDKKMSRGELMSRNTALNEARKRQLNSKG